MHYHWGQTVAKKERGYFEERTSSSANLTVVGWNNNMTVYIASSESSKPERFVQH